MAGINPFAKTESRVDQEVLVPLWTCRHRCDWLPTAASA